MKSSRDGSGPRPPILVVDGDPTGRRLIAEALRRRAFDVANADASTVALDHIGDVRPAAVVVVVDRPESSALLSFVRQLADDRRTREIPVIVAGCDHETVFAQAQGIGNVMVLFGDCAPETLATAVERVLLDSGDTGLAPARHHFPVTCPKCGEPAGIPRSVATAAKRGTYITLLCEKCAQQWRVYRQADTPGFAKL